MKTVGRLSGPVALILCTLLTGCGAPNVLRIDDKSSPVVSARGVVRLGAGPGGPGIEVDYARFRGEGRQDLDSFDLVTLNGQSIRGPVRIDNRATAHHLQLAYNHRLFAGSPAELEWFAGASVAQLDWRATSTNPADPALRRRHSWYGAGGGVTGRLNLSSALAFEMRVSAAGDIDGGAFDGGSRRNIELALAFRPAPGVALRLGLAEGRSSFEDGSAGSDMTLRVRGPFVGLALGY
jgi:hypothetical protein